MKNLPIGMHKPKQQRQNEDGPHHVWQKKAWWFENQGSLKSRSAIFYLNKSNIPGGNLRPKIWLSFNWPPYKDTFFHQIKLIACIAVTKAAPGRNNWPKENPHLASCDTFVMWLSFLFAGLGANDYLTGGQYVQIAPQPFQVCQSANLNLSLFHSLRGKLR